MPFAIRSSNLCEQGFSSMLYVNVKNKVSKKQKLTQVNSKKFDLKKLR